MNNDLISRSALLEEVTRCLDAFIHGVYFIAARDAMRAKRAVIRMLNAALAVDAEPVRHGRWEHGMQCPYCKQIDLAKPNYCPNCGAKMDGDVDAAD